MKVTIEEAAELTGKKPGTIRRYCKEGMPCDEGGRGRGKARMVDPDIVRHWAGLPADDLQFLKLAGDIPQLLAQMIFECWRHADGHDKRKLAGVLCAVWYAGTTGLLDHMRNQNGKVPDIGEKPPAEIEHLRKIARND